MSGHVSILGQNARISLREITADTVYHICCLSMHASPDGQRKEPLPILSCARTSATISLVI